MIFFFALRSNKVPAIMLWAVFWLLSWGTSCTVFPMLWLSVNDLWWLWRRYCSTSMSYYVYLRSLVSDLRFISTFCVFISQKLGFMIWTRKCTFLKKGFVFFLLKFPFHVHICLKKKIKMASIVGVVFPLVKWHICVV